MPAEIPGGNCWKYHIKSLKKFWQKSQEELRNLRKNPWKYLWKNPKKKPIMELRKKNP